MFLRRTWGSVWVSFTSEKKTVYKLFYSPCGERWFPVPLLFTSKCVCVDRPGWITSFYTDFCAILPDSNSLNHVLQHSQEFCAYCHEELLCPPEKVLGCGAMRGVLHAVSVLTGGLWSAGMGVYWYQWLNYVFLAVTLE